jgi:hypothetical protein
MTEHPSFLQLDRFVLGVAGSGTAAHVQGCELCRAHLGRCELLAPAPAALRERAARWRPALRTGWLFTLPAMLALGLFIAFRPPLRDEVTAKNAPSVAVYVKHGAAVSLWDGRAPLSPGDGLRLKVAPAGFSRVTVASVGLSAIVELYAGEVDARGETLLPESWTVDADPRPEIVLVVFSRAPLSPADLRAARDDLPRSKRLWSTRMELWKKEKP